MLNSTIKKKEKHFVSIFAHTNLAKDVCENVIIDCLKDLDHQKISVAVHVEQDTGLKLRSGACITHLFVVGDTDGRGWVNSGMRDLCACLERSGYYIQTMNSSHSFISRAEDEE
ncbi:MAG: hypothetical protein WCI36_03355 [bacterium]